MQHTINKNKELQVSNLLSDYSLDFLVLTETWLTSKDNQWLESTILNRDNYKFYHHNRKEGRGGGLALICKSNLKVHTLDKGSTNSFENATWKIQIRNKGITVTGVYHLPYSLKNKSMNKMFLDDFTKLTTNIMPKHPNNLFVRDFKNLHVSKDDTDVNAAIFNDSIEVMGLY